VWNVKPAAVQAATMQAAKLQALSVSDVTTQAQKLISGLQTVAKAILNEVKRWVTEEIPKQIEKSIKSANYDESEQLEIGIPDFTIKNIPVIGQSTLKLTIGWIFGFKGAGPDITEGFDLAPFVIDSSTLTDLGFKFSKIGLPSLGNLKILDAVFAVLRGKPLPCPLPPAFKGIADLMVNMLKPLINEVKDPLNKFFNFLNLRGDMVFLVKAGMLSATRGVQLISAKDAAGRMNAMTSYLTEMFKLLMRLSRTVDLKASEEQFKKTGVKRVIMFQGPGTWVRDLHPIIPSFIWSIIKSVKFPLLHLEDWQSYEDLKNGPTDLLWEISETMRQANYDKQIEMLQDNVLPLLKKGITFTGGKKMYQLCQMLIFKAPESKKPDITVKLLKQNILPDLIKKLENIESPSNRLSKTWTLLKQKMAQLPGTVKIPEKTTKVDMTKSPRSEYIESKDMMYVPFITDKKNEYGEYEDLVTVLWNWLINPNIKFIYDQDYLFFDGSRLSPGQVFMRLLPLAAKCCKLSIDVAVDFRKLKGDIQFPSVDTVTGKLSDKKETVGPSLYASIVGTRAKVSMPSRNPSTWKITGGTGAFGEYYKAKFNYLVANAYYQGAVRKLGKDSPKVDALKTKRTNAMKKMGLSLVELAKKKMLFLAKVVTIPMPWNFLKIRKDLMAKAEALEAKVPNGYISITDLVMLVAKAGGVEVTVSDNLPFFIPSKNKPSLMRKVITASQGKEIFQFMKGLIASENRYSVMSLFTTSLILLFNRCPAGKTLLTPVNTIAKLIWGDTLIDKINERVKNASPEDTLKDEFFDDEPPRDSFYSDSVGLLGEGEGEDEGKKESGGEEAEQEDGAGTSEDSSAYFEDPYGESGW
jgi:hypothetical protein